MSGYTVGYPATPTYSVDSTQKYTTSALTENIASDHRTAVTAYTSTDAAMFRSEHGAHCHQDDVRKVSAQHQNVVHVDAIQIEG